MHASLLRSRYLSRHVTLEECCVTRQRLRRRLQSWTFQMKIKTTPPPNSKMGKMARFGFRANPSQNWGEGRCYFSFYSVQDCPKFTLTLPEAIYIYIIFQETKATGERSINKCNIKNLPGEKKEPCAEFIINTIMSVFFFFFFFLAFYVLY